MKRIAILGRRGRSLRGVFKPTPMRLQECGNNTGNNMFFYAVDNQLAGRKTHVTWESKGPDIERKADVLVVVAANWIYDGFDLGAVARILETTTIPAIVIGLGVQASNEKHVFNLKPGTERLLKVLRERDITVCARGEFTRKLLQDKWNIGNVIATGCPSNFLNPSLRLGRKMEVRAARPIESAIVSVEATPSHAAANAALLAMLGHLEWKCVLQNPLKYLEILRPSKGQLPDDAEADLAAAGLIAGKPGSLRQYVLQRLEALYDAEAWLDFASRYDFSMGTKLHGNMASFQVGVPTVFLGHDVRTRELADIMQVPTVGLKEALELGTPERIWAGTGFSGEAYDERRRELAHRYVSALAGHGIKVAPWMARIAGLEASAQDGSGDD